MNILFSPAWIASHQDAELSYVMQVEIETLPNKLNYRKFSEKLAEVFTKTMHNRDPELAKLFEASDLDTVSFEVFGRAGSYPWFNKTPRDEMAQTLVFAWLTYAQSLLLGAPSPLKERKTRAHYYDPFVNEGGFCNPIKLKNLEEV